MEKDKDSYYTEIGSVLVRVSNHCTHMKTWEQIFNNNPKLRKSKILSIVFEDTADTFIPECLFQVCPRTHSIEVDEYVYRIHGNGTLINSSDINMIIKALQDIAYGNYYKDPTKKSEYFHRKSFFPDYGNIEITPDGRSIPAGFNGVDYPIEETKNYKNMKKNVQRINESQLRAIVAESVKKVLKESHSMEIEAALQDICRASSLIRNKTEYTQEEDYEPDYEIGYNDAAYLHKWASEIENQAGEWLRN